MSVSNPEGAEELREEDGPPLRRRPSSRTGKHAEYHYWHNFEVREREEARKWRNEGRLEDWSSLDTLESCLLTLPPKCMFYMKA